MRKLVSLLMALLLVLPVSVSGDFGRGHTFCRCELRRLARWSCGIRL